MAQFSYTAEVTNSVLLRLFELGWEDPDWGQLPVALGVHELAGKIADREVGAQIRGLAARVAQSAVQEIVAPHE